MTSMAEPQVPVISRSALTGNIYAVTKYEQMSNGLIVAEEKHDVRSQIEVLVARGDVGDGFHTMPELYRWRLVLHALVVNDMQRLIEELKSHDRYTASLHGKGSVKSWKHSDGRYPFNGPKGEWFIVVSDLPDAGQVSNHYEGKHWDLFACPEVDRPPAWDGHTAEQALERWEEYLSNIRLAF